MEETKYQLLHPGSETQTLIPEEELHTVRCVTCGALVCRAADGTRSFMFCPKCRHSLTIDVIGTVVTVIDNQETKGSLKAKKLQSARSVKEANKQAAALRRQRKAQRNRAAS